MEIVLNGPTVGVVWGREPRLVRFHHSEEIAGPARDQMELRVAALPTEIAVEARDTRRRLVAPACILELLGGKIERPSLICDALAVRIHDDRHRPLCRSLRNIVLDQLAHASIARGEVPPRTTATMCFSSRRTDDTKLYPEASV